MFSKQLPPRFPDNGRDAESNLPAGGAFSCCFLYLHSPYGPWQSEHFQGWFCVIQVLLMLNEGFFFSFF